MVVYYRRLPRFEYLSPATLEEALSLLARHGARAKVLAGGTDLIPKLKNRDLSDVDYLIDLNKIAGLNSIVDDGGRGLRIGALTRLRDLELSPLLNSQFSPLQQAAQSIGSVQVRNRGTVAGNLCNAVPSADLAPALLVLQAKLSVIGPGGQREIGFSDFFLGPNRTALSHNEIVSEIRIPHPLPSAKGVYLKHSPRKAMDLAVVGVAALLRIEKGICQEILLALGAVAPTPMRALEAEKVLQGKKVNADLIAEAARQAALACRPIDDHRSSAAYRREMVEALTRRAIGLALRE